MDAIKWTKNGNNKIKSTLDSKYRCSVCNSISYVINCLYHSNALDDTPSYFIFLCCWQTAFKLYHTLESFFCFKYLILTEPRI